MKRHLNLMSSRSRVRSCVRTRLRQWTIVLATVTALLLPTWCLLWWPIHQKGQQVATLDAKFEPLRQMNQDSKRFQRNIERVRAQEKTSLALAKIDTPVVTLLGMVSKAIADNQGRVVIEKLEFHQSAAVLSQQKSTQGSNSQTALHVEGLGIDEKAISRLVRSVKSTLPFANIQSKPSKPRHIRHQDMQTFLIQCLF